MFAIALSGQAGERLLAQIGMETSADTLLRLVKQPVLAPVSKPSVIGVDDFALRRGKTYGTLVVDLTTNRPIDLLKERTADALLDWLLHHPGIELMSRDRSSE